MGKHFGYVSKHKQVSFIPNLKPDVWERLHRSINL